jgi:pentatricopeptide repeat protein
MTMKAHDAKHGGAPGRGSAWPWILGTGCVLVILIAMLLPRPAGRTGRGAPAAAPGAAAPAQIGGTGGGLRPHAPSGGLAGQSAQEIVAGKVVQYARKRWETVQAMARHFKVEVPDEVKRFFDAVQAGRLEEADALFKSMKAKRESPDRGEGLQKLWPAITETYGITEQAHSWPAQKLLDYGNAVLDSLRPGMVYVGGTDCGRFIPTLLNETSDASQHIILTQNALADGTYLDYVRFLYGDQMATLTPEESQRAFSDYLADATKRMQHDQQFPDEPKQLRPGEEVHMTDGRVQVSGQVAVMGINELLLQTLMQKNPDTAFALEESFPLKSTYAGATTLGPIMELGTTDAQAALTPERATQSLDYWRTTTEQLLADPETPTGSTPRDAYSKLLVSQANLFLDRNFAGQAEEALRLATQLAPASPEAVFNYAGLLAKENRFAEASQLAQTALTLAPANQQFQNLLQTLNQRR